MLDLRARGEIVERQSYLNGTRYLQAEGNSDANGEGWLWSLALTLPKEEGEQIGEGDCSLLSAGRSWYADIVGGAYTGMVDEELDAPVIDIRLILRRRDDGDSSEPWLTADAHLLMRSDECELTLVAADGA